MRTVILLIGCVFFIPGVNANVIINSTRVIFPAEAKSVSVQLINKSQGQHLIQAWVDDGRQNEKPENIVTPFMIFPPVVKVNGNEGQILKISRDSTADKLPQDRESVFWLNVLDIPPTPENLDASLNYMQVAIRNRIKIFWRPQKLMISPQSIAQHLGLKAQHPAVCINNDSPYYLTVVQLMKWDGKSSRVQQGKRQDNLLEKTLFIPPFSCTGVAEKPLSPAPGHYQLVYIDDFGGRTPVVVTLKK